MRRNNMAKAVVSITSLIEQLSEMDEQGFDIVEISVVDKGGKFYANDIRLAPYNYTEFDAVDLDSLPESED